MKYTNSHEWALLEDGEAKVGVTDFAKKELEDIVYVQLPEVGTKLKQGDEAVVVESTKAATDIYTPLSGEVSQINEEMQKKPAKLHTEKDNWLFRLRDIDLQEYEDLLSEEEYVGTLS